MPTFGLAFLAIGTLLIRQVAVGRTRETPEDLKALATALLNGDSAGIQAVMTQRGTNADVEVSGEVAASGTSTSGNTSDGYSDPQSSSNLLNMVVRLGSGARGYVLGAVGPDHYDCSGLVWDACRKLGIYTGSRFTTSTFEAVGPQFAQRVSKHAIGDIVLWPGDHMGVVSGSNTYYSARSPSKGIGPASLSGDVAYFGGNMVQYWRVK